VKGIVLDKLNLRWGEGKGMGGEGSRIKCGWEWIYGGKVKRRGVEGVGEGSE
jgi:hypothetical protein